MILKKNGVHLISVMEPIAEEKFYHLDPLTAPLVLEAFQQYDNGDKMVEIVNFLNDKGVRNMQGDKNDSQQREHHVEEPSLHW